LSKFLAFASKCSNFAAEMWHIKSCITNKFLDFMHKKRLYIFSLWVATLSVLLSTVMTHHHHMGRICMIEEQCQQDGQVNDEHTEHHDEENEADRENCRVHQMHSFFTNAKVVKSIQKLIFDGSLVLDCLPPHTYYYIATDALIAVRWLHKACPLPSETLPQKSRRGPPVVA